MRLNRTFLLMRNPHLPALCVMLLLAGGFRALADGPHWQVPNPEYNPEAEEKAKKDKKNKKPQPVRSMAIENRDYYSNPGDFFKLDDACIKYYSRHCALSYAGAGLGNFIAGAVVRPGKKRTPEEMRRDFYLLIMQRCAQAMREVDQYLPCPDSFPLWHEEVLREEMIIYATRTWVLASKLPPEDAKACLEFCVKAYTDTVRFAGDLKNPAAPNWLAELAKNNKEISTIMEQMAAEKDPKKSEDLRMKWYSQVRYAAAHSVGNQLAKQYTTFRLTTGDIPICVSDAEVRMAQALVEVGPSVIPFLLRDPGRNNPNVQRAVRALIETMKSRWNLNNDLISMNPTAQNVADLLGQFAAKPLDTGSQARRRALESMGPKAWDHLVRLAESGSPEVQKEALSMLRAFTKKPAPATLEDIKTVVAELLAAEKAKEQPPPKPLDLDPTTTKKDGEKRPDAPPDEPETE